MKKKKIFIPLCILGGLAALFLITFIIISIVCQGKGWSISCGRLYLSDNGDYILINDKDAMIMTNQSDDEELFDNLTTGDKLLVVHDGVEESFPGRTGVYHCIHLCDGDIDDIPTNVINKFIAPHTTDREDITHNFVEECIGTTNMNVQYIRTGGGPDWATYPVTTVIRSRDELLKYYETNKNYYYLERRDSVNSYSTIGFLDACDKYDDKFFKDNLLILVLLQESSGSIRHTVTGVASYPSGTNRIIIKRKVPEAVTMAMAQWHIFIELDSETFVDKVEVKFE